MNRQNVTTQARTLTRCAFARLPSALLAGAFLLSAGCSGEKSEQAPTSIQGEAFLLGTRVWTDSETTSYFHVVPSLDEQTTIDPSRALEVPGAAKLYGLKDIGWFAVGTGEEPTIVRYVLDADGRLAEDARISLQPYGVHDLWDTLYVVSKEKIYYPDRAGQQLIVINPVEMRVEGSIDLAVTGRTGYLSLYGYEALVRPGKLIISVGWFDWETNDSVLPETGLLLLDTATDRVERFETDARCGGITRPIVLSSGDAYFVSSALASAAHQLGRLATKPCALRVVAGSEAFDPSYYVELGAVVPSALVGEPAPGANDAIFLRAFDEQVEPLGSVAATWELTGKLAWRWWRWDPQSNVTSPVAELTPSTADVLWFEIDGRVFGTETTADYAQTTLIELTHETGPKRGLTAPGFLHGVAQVR